MAWSFYTLDLCTTSRPCFIEPYSSFPLFAELDDKTKQMLKLIDQDADSFAQRAEMYYKKRPVLVDMLGDLYRAHRSLAEQYDTLKHGSGTRRSMLTPSSSTKSWSPASMDGKATGSSSANSLCSESYDSESEVDDPEEQHDEKVAEVSDAETEAEKNQADQEAELMRAEIKKLNEQNSELQKAIEENKAALKAELAAKDEEKREVIRQLASSIDIVKQENYTLRELCMKSSKQHPAAPSSRAFDLKKLTKDLFSAKLFTAHCRPSGPLVAL